MKHSVNDFNKAMANLDVAIVEQNRSVEQMNYDVVDLVNQIINSPVGPSIVATPLKTPQDIAYLMAQCSAKLRIILATLDTERNG